MKFRILLGVSAGDSAHQIDEFFIIKLEGKWFLLSRGIDKEAPAVLSRAYLSSLPLSLEVTWGVGAHVIEVADYFH